MPFREHQVCCYSATTVNQSDHSFWLSWHFRICFFSAFGVCLFAHEFSKPGFLGSYQTIWLHRICMGSFLFPCFSKNIDWSQPNNTQRSTIIDRTVLVRLFVVCLLKQNFGVRRKTVCKGDWEVWVELKWKSFVQEETVSNDTDRLSETIFNARLQNRSHSQFHSDLHFDLAAK